MNSSPLHDRMMEAAGGRSLRRIAELTRTNHETVRRYLTGHLPSVEFLHAFSTGLGLNADWLLTGIGPMLANELPEEAARRADAAGLLTAIGAVMQRMSDRVDRLETMTEGFDARLRGREPIAAAMPEVKPAPGFAPSEP